MQKKIHKKLQAALACLGKDYCIKTIDLEECVYRDMKNGFDIEVSGICSRRKNAIAVYVWDVRHGKNCTAQIVERVRDIGTLAALKTVLDGLLQKYGNHPERSNQWK